MQCFGEPSQEESVLSVAVSSHDDSYSANQWCCVSLDLAALPEAQRKEAELRTAVH
jgi:hypothetical protein